MAGDQPCLSCLVGWLPPPLTYSRNRDARFLGSAIDATELLLGGTNNNNNIGFFGLTLNDWLPFSEEQAD